MTSPRLAERPHHGSPTCFCQNEHALIPEGSRSATDRADVNVDEVDQPGLLYRVEIAATAPSLDQARADFEKAWQAFSTRRTEADYQAWRDRGDWTAEKYRRFDRSERMPADWRQATPKPPARACYLHCPAFLSLSIFCRQNDVQAFPVS
jgi:hypothetical protein